MGNMWCCCILRSRHPNRVHPTNSRIAGLDDQSVDSFSDSPGTGKCPAAVRDATSCPTLGVVQAEAGIGGILREAEGPTPPEHDNESEVRETDGSMFEDGVMDDWIASILIHNALLPSYATFNTRRHLSMRSKYTEMIQKMNHSTTITERIEENKVETSEQPRNTFSLVKSIMSDRSQKFESLFSQFSAVGKTTGKPPVDQNSCRANLDTIVQLAVGSPSSVTKETRHVVKRRPDAPPSRASGRSAGDASTKGQTSPTNRRRNSASAFPAKSFQITSDWLDEDFKESILSDPRPSKGENEQSSYIETPQHSQRTGGSSHAPVLTNDGPSKVQNEADDATDLLFSPVATAARCSVPRRRRFLKMFKKKSCPSISYSTDDSSWQ